MYVSRAVESIRADPIAGESIGLVLETAPDAEPRPSPTRPRLPARLSTDTSSSTTWPLPSRRRP
ncbi:hypothetical protein ACFQL1_10415 [Halomicroarcula sp. GCM10025709]|uniref:hypothetical protein n=1 Tax=Halomicroarcula sp. GCM10025709 TaxID=3252669 RepID=UPI00361175E0